MVGTWLGECCRQVEAEEVSNSRNKIHQTTYQPLFPPLYTEQGSILSQEDTALQMNIWRHLPDCKFSNLAKSALIIMRQYLQRAITISNSKLKNCEVHYMSLFSFLLHRTNCSVGRVTSQGGTTEARSVINSNEHSVCKPARTEDNIWFGPKRFLTHLRWKLPL